MAGTETDERTAARTSDGPDKPLDKLLQAVEKYAMARGQHLADRAADRLGDLTERLGDVAESGGAGMLPSLV
jgi:hypothetical protein